VLSADDVAAAMADRTGRPLILIDLALPRDIDPMAARLSHVFLYNLDDLAQISTANRAARVSEVTRARVLLSTKADLLWRTLVRSASAGRPLSDRGRSAR
jgi:glutamyl-tRNA reductase